MDYLLWLWALSIRQPWASLVILGLKDIENRFWTTKYRGLLLIHAGTILDRPAMALFPMKTVPTGVILGSVKLVDVIQFTRKTWKDWGDRHLDIGRFPTGQDIYAWILEDPRPFDKPVSYIGALKLFKVDSAGVRRALIAS